MMRKSFAILGMIGTFLLGLVIGSLVSSHFAQKMPQTSVESNQPSSAPVHPHIAELEANLAQNPKDAQLWVELGNAYFDSNSPNQAIKAYEMALKLGLKNSDILTDLGTMYRATKQFEKAVAAFSNAKMLDPKHLQSRINLGIVLYYDLSKVQPAVEIWEEALRIDPKITMSSGDTLAELVERLKKAK